MRGAPQQTALSELLMNPAAAPAREQLQAVVGVLLGIPSVRHCITLGVDPWLHVPDAVEARVRLNALRKLLGWIAAASGDDAQQQLVDLIRRELPALLQLLDEQRNQPGSAVGEVAGGVFGLGGQRVVNAPAGVEPVVLVGQLAKDLFSVRHGGGSSESGGDEASQPNGAIAPVAGRMEGEK